MAPSKLQAQQATLAFQRFGLGARRGGLARIANDPAAALVAELDSPDVALIKDASLPTYAQACLEGASPTPRPENVRLREYKARIAKHLQPEIGFVERLTIFWANHFAMSFRKAPLLRGTIGQFERDVIRRNALGSFPQMLHDAMRHPAMIRYLDNDESIGEESTLGLKRRVSYTENLARELMELHTVGSGNFTEDDVKALAKMLTGWSIVRASEATPASAGQFMFRPDWHQPGPQRFFGETIPEGGMEQADRAFAILAAHPATARRVATKLARHFVADQPTEEMIAPIAQAFIDSGGDLKRTAEALLTLDAAWSVPMAKIRTPYEMLVAQFRALGSALLDEESGVMDRILTTLNQPTWDTPSPEGFADETPNWLSPNAMAFRLDAVQQIAKVIGRRVFVNPATLSRDLFGAALSTQTRERVAAGGSQLAGLTILFASPEFQRR
ncbi:DUF1800 domain-containing protein [Chenggangzhangella methanolivorans]|uniref:DUF1800 domain-containing protein n=1 Tax=Chenggangzhangella methanolivorans TaxID=1437009 RepID=A0A9E6UHI6_9HYPH|nr:DUF1800 domain-containing protein [Chenggangzhangella methanolivorans]QZN99822.1 DUF1800 domain-containing protein [Chenggangzhangella methanolivorans]